MLSGNASPSVLIVLHQDRSTPGRVGRLLQKQGLRLDIRRPSLGDPLPSTLECHVGAVIFGGPMSANDPDDFIRREIDWIGVPLRENKPFLGICLGAQMLAKHLGGTVARHPEGRVEIGYYPIRATPALDDLSRDIGAPSPNHVYHWHREGCDLPAGACLLAGGDDFAVQAFRQGEAAYGLQFHPEVTYAMMCRWTVHGGDRLEAPGAKSRQAQLEGWFRHDAALARWIDGFLRGWVSLGGSAAPPLALTA